MFTSIKNFFSRHMLFYYAMSMAASWAWGTSLIVGMGIVQDRGILPFVIWAIANSLSLPLFGYIAFKIPKLNEIMKTKPIMLFTTAVQCFCLWIQMNAIYEILTKYNIAGDTTSKIVAIAIAVIFLFGLFKNGLMRNVSTDQPIWSICYIAMVVIAIIGFASGNGFQNIPLVKSSEDISWALYTCIVLFSGPLMDIQNWQLARKVYEEKRMKSYYLAGILFAIYMALVFVLAYLQFNRAMDIIMVLAIICVATSTINNAIVGVQEIAGRKVGFAIAGICIASWQIVIPMGVMGLWLTMGTARIYVSIACIIAGLIWHHLEKKKITIENKEACY